jgi:hypothetical protein
MIVELVGALTHTRRTSIAGTRMVRYTFGILPPLTFLFSVMMYLGDFRIVAIAFAVVGCISYVVGKELHSKD